MGIGTALHKKSIISFSASRIMTTNNNSTTAGDDPKFPSKSFTLNVRVTVKSFLDQQFTVNTKKRPLNGSEKMQSSGEKISPINLAERREAKGVPRLVLWWSINQPPVASAVD